MWQLKCYLVALVLLPLMDMQLLKVRENHDPGMCTKENHGQLILVKDRESKDTILVCTEDKGVYNWKTTEGSKPPGEYFNPAYDCLEILNKNTKAKDGFYWVNFHRPVLHKVWCDMSTDGGGYMLIGRMNDSTTWDVPSNNTTVNPDGLSQWSSAFGDVPILDFRIQVAIGEKEKQIKAHWSFRLRNKRPLNQLMMVNEGGCPYHLPGIGDISFVKDLITEEITSNDFPCSVFGTYSHPSAKIGWTMMNSCLEKPCPYGFAYHHLFPVQIDFSGGFRFLAKNNSESSDGSTAFFGCDKGKCCACYGPPGGSGVYCGKECKSKNGGTITKSANAWFWVRLNPPQKVWEKCTEYRTEEENGDLAWYKLVGDRNIPVKGRCGKSEAILNDRILKTINESFSKLELMVELLHSRDISASTILKNEPKTFLDKLKEWTSFSSLKRCYRASEDGWTGIIFYLQCRGFNKTVTLIKVGKYIFGGYSNQLLSNFQEKLYEFPSINNSFIFSFRNKDDLGPFKSNTVHQNRDRSHRMIYPRRRRNHFGGPTFGGGPDIYIPNNAKSSSGYTNFGHTYRPPPGYSYNNSNTRSLLAGSYRFYASEIEVYYFS